MHTKRIACPFKIYARRYLYPMQDTWTFEIQCGVHNHGPVLASSYPTNRRLNEAQISEIENLSTLGVRAKKIVTKLREEDSSCHVIPKQITNIMSRHRLRKFTASNPTASIVEQLRRDEIPHKIWQSPTGEVTQFFFTTEQMIDFSRRYHRVFLADCTYKTNKWGMPLLHIVGLTSTGSSFLAAACFMMKETEEAYTEALETFRSFLGQDYEPEVLVTDRKLALMNAIPIVFPNCSLMLCSWHIMKSVLAKTKRGFGKGCRGA